MRISEAGLSLIKEFEGCRLKAYRCPAGVWTIGYGHTETAERGMTIDQNEAENLLINDMARYEYAVSRHIKKGINLKQCQFDALVSFTYNCGEGNFEKIAPYINRKQFDAVPGRLMLYKKARVNGELKTLNGLVRRRRAECELWRGLRGSDEPIGDMPQIVEAETIERKPLSESRTIWGHVVAFFCALGALVSSWWDTIKKIYDAAQDPISMLQGLFGQAELSSTTILIILGLTGLAISTYAKIDDNKNGEVA